MKKIVTIILCLLSVLCASASPMFGGAVQAPVARMTSTSSMMRSSYGRSSVPTNTIRVQGFRTSAAYVTGGVTSNQMYTPYGAPRRLGSGGPTPPTDPTGECQCEWYWDGEKWVCSKCGSTMTDDDLLDGHFHDGDCPCPVEFDWKALLFLTAAAGVYMAKNTKKSRA